MAQTDYTRRKGTTPNTSTVISSKVKVYAGGNNTEQVGVIANFDPSESRSAEPVRGIGFGDQIAELVPGMTDPVSISIGRTAQYLTNLYQAFGYKGGIEGMVRSLKHHRWPFDIRQEIVMSWLVNPGTSASPSGESADVHDVGDTTVSDARLSSTSPGTSTYDNLASSGAAEYSGSANLKALKTIYEGCWFTDWNTSFTSDTTIVSESGTVMCTDIYADGFSDLASDQVLNQGLVSDVRALAGA